MKQRGGELKSYSLVLFFALFMMSSIGLTQEMSETFVVRNFDSYVQVLAPQKMHSQQAVIIENKTLENLIGRLSTPDDSHVKFLSIGPKESKSVTLPGSGHRSLIFVPMSPAFQEVELKIGMKSYEIPAKR